MDKAAQATRRYSWHFEEAGKYTIYDDDVGETVLTFRTISETLRACDRLNLIAVLEAIMEPSEDMVQAGVLSDDMQTGAERVRHIFRAMVDRLIAETKGSGA